MTRIGKYEIQAELGRGGFGRVFRAYDPAVGRQVAIKILTAEGDKSLSTRFRNEAAAAGKLRHKNIVTVYDFGEYKGTPFLVMEYLEGEDLHHAMNRPGGLTLLQKVSIMSQVAEGLHCAHENGVIHRDVKPANIMVLKDGTAKIMDFGIARMLREDATRLTRKGDLIGTMLYMSPEQFTSSEVDALCDVFAYGVIYYELLTGKHPFRAPDAAAMMYKITVEDPDLVQRLAPECPQELEDMVHRAIQKDRDLRYQSMREIQLDAEPILIGLQQERAAELIAGAQALFEKRDLEAARELVLEGLNLDPANRTGRQLRESLQKALQRATLQPRLDALLTRAGEDLAARRFADAIQNMEAALRLDRTNTAVVARLEEARAAMERSRRTARLIAEARRDYQRGDLEASRSRVAEALREDAGSPEAQAILQRLEEEIRAREEARRLKEGLARASSLLAVHSFDEAVAELERLVGEHPRSEEAAQLLARARAEKAGSERRRRLRSELASAADLLREQRFEEAAAALEAISREFPGEQEVADLMGYARRELQAQRRAEAIRALTGEVGERLERHDFAGAFALVEEALKSYPGESGAVRLLRSIKTAQAEWERRQAIEEAARRSEELAAALRFGEALEELDAAARHYGSEVFAEQRTSVEERWAQHRREEAIRAALAQARERFDRGDFEGAAAVARASLETYPGEARLAAMVNEAEAAEQARREAIARLAAEARALAGTKDFDRALHLIEDRNELSDVRREILAARAAWEREQAIEAAAREVRDLLERGDPEAALARVRTAEHAGDARLSALAGEAELALREIANLEREARRLLKARSFDEALETARRAQAKYPVHNSLEALEGDIRAAREAFEREREIAGLCEEARALMAARDYEKAAAALRAGAGRYPGERRVAMLLADAERELEAQRRTAAIAGMLEESAALKEAREFGLALKALDAGLEAWPGEPALREARELALRERTVWERERAIEAVAERARLAIGEGRFPDAAALLSQSLVSYPEARELRALLKDAEEKQRRVEAEAALCEEVAQLCAAKQFDRAIARVREGLASHPGHARLAELERAAVEGKAEWQRRRAREAADAVHALLRQRRYEDVVKRAREALRECPDAHQLEELLREGEKRQAQHAAAKDAAARGAALASAGQYDEALRLLDEAAQSYPEEEVLERAREGVVREKAAAEREEALSAAVRRVEALRAEGRLEEALRAADEALHTLGGAPLLEAVRGRLAEEVERARRRGEDLGRLRELERRQRSEPQPPTTEEAARECREAAARWPRDAEIEAAAAAVMAQAEAIGEVAGLFAREEYLRAVEACRARLRADPEHAFFARLEREAGERHVRKAEQFLAALDARLNAEPDLDRRLEILHDGLRRYPDEPRLQVELRFHEARRELVQSILHKARAHEEAGEYDEALEQWGALESAYRQYPGIEEQVRRVRALRDRNRADAQAHWVRQIERAIETGAFANAENLLHMAREEFPGDAGLDTLERTLKARAEAARMLADAERLCSQRRYEEACQMFGLAHNAEAASPAFRARVLEALERQALHAGADWRSAELLVKHARGLDPRWTVPSPLKAAIDEGRRAESAPAAVAEATVVERPPTVLERLPPPPAPARRRIPILAAAVGLLAAAGAFFAWYSRRAEPKLVMEVRTVPEGASVQLGEEACITPNCRFEVAPGEHRMTFSKPGYEPAVRTVVADAGNPELLRNVRVELIPLPQTLQISSNLSSGSVWLDGRQAGRLQDGQMAVAAVPPGAHQLRISGPDGEMEMSFHTSEGEPPRVSPGLRAKDLKAVIATAFAGEVRVYCNCEGARASAGGGEPVEVGAAGAQIDGLAEGVHELRITEGSATRTVVLPVRAAPAMNVFLTADRNVGTLVVEAGEPGARVLLNGRYRATSASGVLRLQVEPGAYEVRVEKQGYQPAPAQRAEVRKGEETRAPFRLVPVPQVARLAVTGASAGTQIRLDGKPLGAVSADGSFNATVPPGEHVLEFVKGAGRREVRRQFGAGATIALGAEQVAIAEPVVPQPPVLEPEIGRAPAPAAPPPAPAKPADTVEWERVAGSRNPADFAEFLQKFPRSRMAAEAGKRLEQLEWEIARAGGSEPLRAFLNKYPRGAFAPDASALLAKLERAEQAAAEGRAVIDVIRRYAEAWKARNYDQLVLLHPALRERKINRQSLQDFLKGTVFVLYALQPMGEPEINGEEAKITCRRTLQQRFDAVLTDRLEGTVVFTLRKSGGQWRIRSD